MPTKKKRYTRATDPLNPGKRYNPLGTKRDGERHQRTRDLKNKIHELEQEIAVLKLRDQNASNRETEHTRRIAACKPTKAQREALQVICDVGISEAVKLGIHEAIVVLCGWQDDLTDRYVNKVDSGNLQLERMEHLAPIPRGN
jgi:hypothetical protein